MPEKLDSESTSKTEEQKTTETLVNTKKGNKAIIMMGIVTLVSVGCAFLFVSKVYPSLMGSTSDGVEQPAGIEQEDGQVEDEHVKETVKEQTVQSASTDMKPASTSKKKEEKNKEEKSKEPVEEENLIVAVDTIIVNLSASNGRRYLKAKINLEAKDADVRKKIESKQVQIKDRLISILSSKTLEEIDGLEGQEVLRNEIKDAVDVIVKVEGGVLQVYFTEFVVQ